MCSRSYEILRVHVLTDVLIGQLGVCSEQLGVGKHQLLVKLLLNLFRGQFIGVKLGVCLEHLKIILHHVLVVLCVKRCVVFR